MLAAHLKKNLGGSMDPLVPLLDRHAPDTPVSP